MPALPAWSLACPATCSSPAPAPSLPAHCPPAASTSTPTHPAGHPTPFQPLAMASQRRNVSLGIWGLQVPRGSWEAPPVIGGRALWGREGCTGAPGNHKEQLLLGKDGSSHPWPLDAVSSQPPCSHLKVLFPEHLLSDLTSPIVPCLVWGPWARFLHTFISPVYLWAVDHWNSISCYVSCYVSTLGRWRIMSLRPA